MKDSVKTNQSVNKLLESELKRQIVIDAGALSALSESELQLLSMHDTILTPHRGEFGKVFNKKFYNDLRKDASLVAEIALKYKTVILVKGQIDIISDGFKTKFNKTGHPGMTVGGSGDVLTGIIGTLFSVTNDAYTSACLGAYISGAAGELASQQFGNGLMASDITKNINKVIAKALSFKPKEK
jgi:NAD(P)H-hydrate epimerase